MTAFQIIKAELRPTLMAMLLFTGLTGLAYPLAMTVVAQVLFHHKANGSLIEKDGKVIGSELIGQPFDDPKYFWSRPSATAPFAYNAGASTGSNQAVSNPAQIDAITQRVKTLQDVDPNNKALIPVDLVTASGSGLDPHISVEAAKYQVARVARARGLTESPVSGLVDDATEQRQLGLLGEPRVNVVELNLTLDQAAGSHSSRK